MKTSISFYTTPELCCFFKDLPCIFAWVTLLTACQAADSLRALAELARIAFYPETDPKARTLMALYVYTRSARSLYSIPLGFGLDGVRSNSRLSSSARTFFSTSGCCDRQKLPRALN